LVCPSLIARNPHIKIKGERSDKERKIDTSKGGFKMSVGQIGKLEIVNNWNLKEKSLDKGNITDLFSKSTIFLLGNGYMGYRGTFEEWGKEESVACILSNTYDRNGVKPRELCNAPNAFYTKVFIGGEELSFLKSKSSKYERELNLKSAILKRKVILEDDKGNKYEVRAEKFCSMNNFHLLSLQYSIKSIDSKAEVMIETGIDGDVWDINGPHFKNYRMGSSDETISIEVTTQESETKIAVAETCRVLGGEIYQETISRSPKKILRRVKFSLDKHKTVTLEKTIAIYTSRDGFKDPLSKAIEDLKQNSTLGGYNKLKERHLQEWKRLWDKSDIVIKGDEKAQILVRYSIYQAIIATPLHTDKLPVGGRGLSCQTYQGAGFWDQDIFILPMFLYTQPRVARNLLKYRYNTLSGAKRKAKRLGYYGAFYAWQSQDTGDEECPSYVFKDVLYPERSFHNHFNDRQIHISADVAYAIWNYYLATGDEDFLFHYGAEILFETAQFFVSYAYFKKDKGRYELLRVIGCDEYHENVNNNTFTNMMVRFNLTRAVKVYYMLKERNKDLLQEIMGKVKIQEKEVEKWDEIASLLYIPSPDKASGLIEQFDGYFALEDIFPSELKKRCIHPDEYMGCPIGPAVETQVLKQADIIMLFFLFDKEYEKEVIKANFEYYEPRTEHGSSLSYCAYSMVASRIGKLDLAYDYLLKSATVDILDRSPQYKGKWFLGGTHVSAYGGTWQAIIHGFIGLFVDETGLKLSPLLPKKWEEVSFNLIYKGQKLNFLVRKGYIEVRANSQNNSAVPIGIVNGKRKICKPGQQSVFSF